jgi:AraC-like DNA-binding protein
MDDEILYGFPERAELDTSWLQEQIGSGASAADIVKLTGYSLHYINKAIKELGLNAPRNLSTSTSTPKEKPKARPRPKKSAIQKQRDQKAEAKSTTADQKRKRIDVEWLQQQLDSGTPIAEIARQAGYSRFGIYYNIDKHDLNIPKKEGIDPDWLREQKMLGKTDAEIAEESGLNPGTIRYYRKKYGIDAFIVPTLEG